MESGKLNFMQPYIIPSNFLAKFAAKILNSIPFSIHFMLFFAFIRSCRNLPLDNKGRRLK